MHTKKFLASVVFVSSALVTLLALPISAQQFPSQQRGLSADTAYQVGAVDSINLFNGGMTLRIPVGPTYPVSPVLSYNLTLTYSSNGWDFEPGKSCFNTNTMETERYSLPVPSPHTNAGFGWRINPGKLDLNPPIGSFRRYISPDGGEHGLYDELHPGYGGQANTWYTNDSTYLRMRYYGSGSGVCTAATGGSSDCYQIEFPDGAIHEFHDFGSASDPQWLLTRMEDRFTHDAYVAFDYSVANQWTITDSHSRSHKVTFSNGTISTVELEAFDTATPATYTFTTTPATIDRQGFFPPDCAPSNHTTQISVRVLDKLTLPDGSYYAMSQVTTTAGGQNSGGLEHLRLPTGGGFAWTYGLIDFVSQAPGLNGQEYANSAYAVQTKKLYTSFDANDDPETEIGEWAYEYITLPGQGENFNPSAPGDTPPCFHTVTVTDPIGHATVNYFDSASPAVSRWQYGLPFRRCDDSGSLLSPPFLSQEIYEGHPDDPNSTKLRSVYVEYESDGRDAGAHQEKNHRLKHRQVVYHDDSDVTKEVTFSDFDGLGHYRQVTTKTQFSGSAVRTVTTNFNAANNTLELNPEDSSPTANNDFVLPSLTDPWVLETFSRRDVTENGDTATTEFCFDSGTGFLERSRIWAGSDDSANDVLKVFAEAPGGIGFVGTESTYGGDAATLDTQGDLCTLQLPGTPERRLVHTYAHGVLESTHAVDPCDDAVVLKVADYDIDANTGFVKTSRDSAGVATNYRYDAMNRLFREEPAGSAWTNTTYTLPTSPTGSAPSIEVRQCPSGATGCTALAWRRSRFDGLGRVFREEIQYPNASGIEGAFRLFTYDALGRKTEQSMWEDGNLTTDTTYDRFGRPTKITPPDLNLAPTILVYRGERRIDRSDKVASGVSGAEPYMCQREEYDALGRLVLVSENRASDAQGSCDGSAVRQVTTYSYDEADRLVKVCGDPNAGTCTQERVFTYDNRGFLLTEQHPEIGLTGHGTMSYSYDASGNVLTREVDGSGNFSLVYSYDAANRLIAVDQTVNPLGDTRPIKSFHYARDNDGSDLRAGKLVLSKRTNWIDPVPPLPNATGGDRAAVVSQAYRYEGLDGRVSKRQTRYNLSSDHYVFETDFAYDELGNIISLGYPDCLHALCEGRDPERTVSFQYERGYLSSVPGYATALDYQLGGMLHTVTHANGVVETIETNTKHFQRPHRITTSGVVNGGWNSGEYVYDSSGNIKAIGSQTYRYDRMSRLVEGNVLVNGQLKTQSMTYDVFGNILAMTTDGNTQSTPVEGATNRLANAIYDEAGNLTDITQGSVTTSYDYDALNMMKTLQSSADQAKIFIYDADDERLISTDCVGFSCDSEETNLSVTVRGLDGKVLRVYDAQIFHEITTRATWSWRRDYVYRDGLLLASVETAEGGGDKVSHFHLDHLGTPRQITDDQARQEAFHAYYPFGEEATDPGQNDKALKFTGHERDDENLDYMHARYCSPTLGRLLSIDPRTQARRAVSQPQLWNRYAYALNNPLMYVDPDGNSEIKVWEIGKYTVKMYPNDTAHGRLHYHVYDKGRRLIGRIDLEGRPITTKGKTPKIPNTLVKSMTKKGLLAIPAMLFSASPANAGENMALLGMEFNKEDILGVSLSLFGTADLDSMSSAQLAELWKTLRELELQEPEPDHQPDHELYHQVETDGGEEGSGASDD